MDEDQLVAGALQEAADALEDRLAEHPSAGRQTRARWAIDQLRVMAIERALGGAAAENPRTSGPLEMTETLTHRVRQGLHGRADAVVSRR